MQNCTLQAKDLVKLQFPLSNIQRGRKVGKKGGKEEEERKHFSFSINMNVSKLEKYKHIFHYIK